MFINWWQVAANSINCRKVRRTPTAVYTTNTPEPGWEVDLMTSA
jgi:hypothetical protein